MSSDDPKHSKKRKEYDFGSIEVKSFNSFIKEHSNNLVQLSVYAIIPACDGDGSVNNGYADLCMSPNPY